LPNPACLVGGSVPPQDVAASSTITGALVNPAGVEQWHLTCYGADDTTGTAAINATLVVNQGTHTFSFTSKAAGTCYVFQSTVGIGSQTRQGAGYDANNVYQKSYTTTFKVNVPLANGLRVISQNEALEQDPTYGLVKEINAVIRANASAGTTLLMGLASARPTAVGSSKGYLCTDVPVIYFDDPATTAWQQFGWAGYQPAPPLGSTGTVVGSLGVTQKGDSLLLTQNGGNSFCAILWALPGGFTSSTSWVIPCGFYTLGQEPQENETECGVCVTTGVTSGVSVAYLMARFLASNEGWNVDEVTLGGTRVGLITVIVETGIAIGAPCIFTRILNDGTSIFYQISGDGEFWRTYATTATPANLTYYGFCLGNAAADGANAAALVERLPVPVLPVQINISNVVSTTLLTFTTSTPHGLATGMGVSIRGITWSGGSAPNGIYDSYGASNFKNVIVIDSTHFTLPGTAAGSYTSGGVVTSLSQ
jgi:hypothetical protein